MKKQKWLRADIIALLMLIATIIGLIYTFSPYFIGPTPEPPSPTPIATPTPTPSPELPPTPEPTETNLLDLTPVNSRSWRPNNGVFQDSLDNSYSEVTPYIILRHNSYGEFFVNSRYSVLSGSLAAHQSHNAGQGGVLRIYTDDRLVFISDSITRTTIPFDFEVDISDALFIRIVMVRNSGASLGIHGERLDPRTLLMNPVLER